MPQHLWLYNEYDRGLGHFRRYDRQGLRALLEKSGFSVVSLRGFNSLAILGWWFNGSLLRRREMDRFQIKVFDTFVPVLKWIERLLPLPGISLIAIAQNGDAGVRLPGGRPAEAKTGAAASIQERLPTSDAEPAPGADPDAPSPQLPASPDPHPPVPPRTETSP